VGKHKNNNNNNNNNKQQKQDQTVKQQVNTINNALELKQQTNNLIFLIFPDFPYFPLFNSKLTAEPAGRGDREVGGPPPPERQPGEGHLQRDLNGPGARANKQIILNKTNNYFLCLFVYLFVCLFVLLFG